MKTLTTTIAALMLATSAHATDCASARRNTESLFKDLGASVDAAQKVTTEADALQAVRSIKRRVDSVRSSLVSVRIYCHGNAGAIAWANKVEDGMDHMDAVIKGGPK